MSVCAEDLSPAMQRIAEAIGEQIVPACMPTCIGDSEPDVDGMQVDCRVSREAPNAEGAFETSAVARCEGEDGAPVIPDDEELCWYPKTGDAMSPQCRDFGWNLEFGILQAGRRRQYEYFRPTCTLSEDWERDCPDLP